MLSSKGVELFLQFALLHSQELKGDSAVRGTKAFCDEVSAIPHGQDIGGHSAADVVPTVAKKEVWVAHFIPCV